MPRVLEGAQPAEDDGEAEVDVRAGRVDPELDAQGAAERELALQLALREDVDGVTEEFQGQAPKSRRPGRGLARCRGASAWFEARTQGARVAGGYGRD